MGTMSRKAIPLEKKRRLILSNRLPSEPEAVDPDVDGINFLKTMLDETKTNVDPNAQTRPNAFDADMSNEQASITPSVSGKSER